MIILMSCFIAFISAQSLPHIYNNNKAVEEFEKKKFSKSHQDFAALLEERPEDPITLYNLGTAMAGLKEIEKSQKLYKALHKRLLTLMDAKNTSQLQEDQKKQYQSIQEMLFILEYNLGTLFATQKNIAEALEWYQQALKRSPDDIKIKTNIELLFQPQKGKGKGDGKGKSKGKAKEKNEDKNKSSKAGDKKQKPKNKKPQKQKFDQKQMSMQDLKRIMRELKKQEGKIRAKIQGKRNNKKQQQDSSGGKQW